MVTSSPLQWLDRLVSYTFTKESDHSYTSTTSTNDSKHSFVTQKTMFKYLSLILLLLSTSVVADSKWYIGGGIGKAIPRLELDERIREAVTLDIPEELGGGQYTLPVDIDSEFSNYGQKLFIGYDFGAKDGFAFELSYVNFGQYEAVATSSAEDSGVITSEYLPFDIPYSISVIAKEIVKADIVAINLSMIYSFKLGDRVSIFPRFGLAYLDVKATSRFSLTASVDTPFGDKSRTWSDDIKDSELKGMLPVWGIGMDIRINENHFIRTEMERYGHPTEIYVDMFTVQWGYRF